MDIDQINAFWSKIDISKNIKDCWSWTGAKKPSGYGNVRINKKYKLAHRVAFELANGKIPDGYLVCHICDNRSCCNPSHLMLGTIKSNAVDMLIKNRQNKHVNWLLGTKNHNSKLNDKKVLEIRNLYSSKELDQYQLAEKFSVTQSCISSLVRGQTWRHING